MSAGDSERTGGAGRGEAFAFLVDGERVPASPGQTIAAALLAAGRRALRWTAGRGEPRGVYCAMGLCGECVMVVDGEPGVRTCVTLAMPGMTVRGQDGWAALDARAGGAAPRRGGAT